MPDLISAASDAKRLGADQVTRIFIGPRWDPPPFEKDLRPLDEKMTRADYQAIFRSFQVIMITAYDLVSSQKQYLDLPPPGNRESREAAETDQFLRDVREEFRRFSFALSKMDRIFILSNWEAENDVPDANAWPGFARYLQARIDGVLAGRREARQQGYPGRVFTAFEFTIVPGFQGRPSGLVEIGSKLQGLDYLSYSAWWSIAWDLDAGNVEIPFREGIRIVRRFAEKTGLPQRIIVGEFGEYWDLYPTAERLQAIIDASIEEGVAFLFNWVLYEQPGEKDEWGRDASHFGKYFLDRTLTPQREAFQRWLRPPASLPRAPFVRQGRQPITPGRFRP